MSPIFNVMQCGQRERPSDLLFSVQEWGGEYLPALTHLILAKAEKRFCLLLKDIKSVVAHTLNPSTPGEGGGSLLS